MESELLANLEKLHTTKLGIERIKRNLCINVDNIVVWCRLKIENADRIVKRGKNWYVYVENSIFIINANSFTIITAHKEKIN